LSNFLSQGPITFVPSLRSFQWREDLLILSSNSLEEAMETTHPREYKSPRRKLLRFFEKSRDKWKLKYLEVKKVLKRLTNRIRFLERSKAEYKQRVEELQAQLAALKASHLEKGDANEALKKRVISRHPL
jgi:predicted RNase H-like nuclease (RuvC/YqgF family)